MELKEKMALIAEVLDVEEELITPETVLSNMEEWDSIAALTLISMLDEKFGKMITAKEIKAMSTIEDILAYMQ